MMFTGQDLLEKHRSSAERCRERPSELVLGASRRPRPGERQGEVFFRGCERDVLERQGQWRHEEKG